MTEVDLMQIDLDAGKPWIELVREEERAKRLEVIRKKNRDKYLAARRAAQPRNSA